MMKKLRRLFGKRSAGGYTLVEVIISTALLGILIVGIMAFITPVFSMLQSSDEAKKAERSVSTMEHYLSKSMRRSLYIKVFTNAALADVNTLAGPVASDADFKTMLNFFDTEEKLKNYTLNCISIKMTTDNNIRNSSTGATATKYMLFNEKFDVTDKQIKSSTPIFEECFYEDIYPSFTFDKLEVPLSSIKNETAESADSGESGETAETVETVETAETGESDDPMVTPALTINMKIYNAEDITNDMNLIFTGKSIIEVNNIKSVLLNKGNKYKIFDNTDLTADTTADGQDIYIFYITRNIGTAVLVDS